MVGSNGTMIAIRLVRSKLRKREDHGNAIHPEAPVAVQTATPNISTVSTLVASHSITDEFCNGNGIVNGNLVPDHDNNEQQTCEQQHNNYNSEQFVWQFPPPYPPPHTPPPQYTLYNDQDTLVHALPADRSGFAKGFRKNIGGRWRRFVKKKPETETCAIPPELKDQLKTIYVY